MDHQLGVCGGWAMNSDGSQTIELILNSNDCDSTLRLVPMPQNVLLELNVFKNIFIF